MYHHASAAYAATAKLALTGTELQAEALFASARRLHAVIEPWPAPPDDLEGALDHAARVWSLILGELLDDEDLPEREAVLQLLHLTRQYAVALRQATGPGHGEKAGFLQALRAGASPFESRTFARRPRHETLQRQRLATA